MNRTATLPARGKRTQIDIEYEAPDFKSAAQAITEIGDDKVLELIYKFYDSQVLQAELDRRELESEVVPKLATAIRAMIPAFKAMGQSETQAISSAVDLLTAQESSPEVHKNLDESQIQEAITLATKERQKPGRKPAAA